MISSNVLLLTGDDILALLDGLETEIVATVRQAYLVHHRGDSSLPRATFLRFPEKDRARIIALPAYLGGDFDAAGIKWIASFPANLDLGIERASAALILNSTTTGRPVAIMESSVISAKRTAAGAALAARTLGTNGPVKTVGLIGCGLINFETLRFLLALFDPIDEVLVCDVEKDRAEQFRARCRDLPHCPDVRISAGPEAVFQAAGVTALATTAVTPHITRFTPLPPGAVILHTSLRDLSPDIILAADNVTDSIDHVCQAGTSLHLAEQQSGSRAFIRGTLAEALGGTIGPRPPGKTTIFSPFGLGILDIAVARLVRSRAEEQGRGTVIPSFFPAPWTERNEGAAAAEGGDA